MPATAALFRQPPTTGGTWLAIVDGMDEVIETGTRSRVLWRLRELIEQEATSRPLPAVELAELRRPGVEEYELRPFDRADLNVFAQRSSAAPQPATS